MTDNEIIKDLKYVVKEAKKSNSVVCETLTHILSKTLDLINRQKAEKKSLIAGQETLQKYIAEQKAEIERLSTLSKLGNMRANDYRVMRDRALKAEKEVERLKKGWKADILLTAKAESEAVKEFAERLKEKTKWLFSSVSINNEIDNLLKEMGGDING